MDASLELWRFQNQRGKARTRDPSCVAKAVRSLILIFYPAHTA